MEINKELSKELVIECLKGNLEKVKDIIYSKKTIDIHFHYNGHPLDFACYKGHLEIVKFLINQNKYVIDINLRNEYGNTAIVYAISNNNKKIVKFLPYQNRS